MELRLSKEMDMIGLHVECTYRPGVCFTATPDFLFDKRSAFPNQNLFPLLRTPDKVIGYLVGDMFGVLCLHAP